MFFKISEGKHLGKRPLVRPRSRWENNIKMGLGGKQETGEADLRSCLVMGVGVRIIEHWGVCYQRVIDTDL
jgi:hypothetical protein